MTEDLGGRLAGEDRLGEIPGLGHVHVAQDVLDQGDSRRGHADLIDPQPQQRGRPYARSGWSPNTLDAAVAGGDRFAEETTNRLVQLLLRTSSTMRWESSQRLNTRLRY